MLHFTYLKFRRGAEARWFDSIHTEQFASLCLFLLSMVIIVLIPVYLEKGRLIMNDIINSIISIFTSYCISSAAGAQPLA